jgi:hypothetical protein
MNERRSSIRALAFAAIMACATAHAGEGIGTVNRLIIRDSDGLIYVDLSAAPTGRPSCASTTTYWMIPNENSETGKKLYALLLSAQLAGRTVSIVGKNACVRWGDGEDILYVILDP